MGNLEAPDQTTIQIHDLDDSIADHPLLHGIFPVHETSDFTLVRQLRKIIEGGEKAVARYLLKAYHFWYHDAMAETSQVFWSENHYIMSSSSELLVREFLGLPLPSDLVKRIECYLDLKATLGLAEFLSPVYYPFTITALLNLYDYARVDGMRDRCQAVLDRIAEQVLAVSLPDTSTVCPSGRSYARHRSTACGHHIGVFTRFLMERGNVEVPGEVQALKEAVRSTAYRPAEHVYRHLNTDVTDLELPLSPALNDLLAFLDQRTTELAFADRMSLLWGHGAFFVPATVADTLRFMDLVDLWRHPHFRALASARRRVRYCCPRDCLACVLTCLSGCFLVRPFAQGALLTGASLVVHREGNVILSSLGKDFNAGLPAFQQWPWAVNLNGVAIWCSFGRPSTGGMSGVGNIDSAHELSTARVMPRMRQEGNCLTALYESSSRWLALWNRHLRPRMRWPEDELDEHGVEEVVLSSQASDRRAFRSCTSGRAAPRPLTWRWGRKGSAAVAWTIVDMEVRVVVRDLDVARVSMAEFVKSLHDQHGDKDRQNNGNASGSNGGKAARVRNDGAKEFDRLLPV